jgi:ubiquinol-cytochrome c reductase cytochrome c subunit
MAIAAMAMLCAPSLVAQTPSSPATPPGSAEKGRQTFAKVGCAQCHGLEAQGSPTTGPRLGPGALPYAAFSRLVRVPRLQMPPYTEKVLSNADLADIYAFVQSRPKPTPAPLLQP